jgi:rod shape-determining protein MreB
VVLSGGVALLKGFAERISRAINTPVLVAENPLFSVALGVGKILDNLAAMKRVLTLVERGAR